jgi:hypothetical protein
MQLVEESFDRVMFSLSCIAPGRSLLVWYPVEMNVCVLLLYLKAITAMQRAADTTLLHAV